MNLTLKDFTKLETSSGEEQYFWSGDYIIEYDEGQVKLPLELTLSEGEENNEYDKSFNIVIRQGQKFHGDEFNTLEEALKDLSFRVQDLYEYGDLTESDKNFPSVNKWE